MNESHIEAAHDLVGLLIAKWYSKPFDGLMKETELGEIPLPVLYWMRRNYEHTGQMLNAINILLWEGRQG